MNGNDPADWTINIVGAITDPIVTVNGVSIVFTGVVVAAGQSLVISTRDRTMILGGNLSVFGKSNFVAWEWDDLLLQPGMNTAGLQGTTPSSSAYMLFCYRDTWL